MGEVWKARDTKLRRDVALKTLPPEFTSDADRLARLEREATLLASLSHPNIASIHGLEQEQGAHVLVLELIDGGTLADRLSRGPIAVEQSLKIALQIAEALEAAHERGVIHRDLKPANVAITPDGRVKVLDFGLAKALVAAGGKAPTVTALRTEIGAVMGTPAYMSPEQARGEVTGRQADIWALGAMLYEMLTGLSPFARDTTAETLARVLDAQPDFNLLPRTTPANARHLLKRSLEKDPKRRLQHSGDVRIELEDAIAALASGPQTALVDPAERRGRALRMTALASGLTVLGFLAGFAVWSVAGRAGPTAAEPVRLSIPSVGDPGFSTVGAHHLALSPDGTRIAYAGRGGLSIRRMSDQETVRVGIEGTNPVFSPDGEWVGFQRGRESFEGAARGRCSDSPRRVERAGSGCDLGTRRHDRIRDDVGSVSSRCRRRTRERADAAGRGEGRASLRMAIVSREQPHCVVHDRARRRERGAENRVARLGLARNAGAAPERQCSALRCRRAISSTPLGRL